MDGENLNPAGNFSLTKSGIFYKLLRRLNLAGTSNRDYAIRLLAICGTVWVPLLILSAFQGLAVGNKVEISFIKDFANHVRFLVVIPILVFAERSVDYRLKELSNFFFTAGILNESDAPQYYKIKQFIIRLSEPLLADLVIILIIIVNLIIRWFNRPQESSYWLLAPGTNQGVSWAGLWYLFISMPVFQYLCIRWIWRWILWFIYFKKISNLPLKLNPAHSDRAGGLGFLGVPPGPFLQITLALSILFTTAIADKIFFFHDRLQQYYALLGGFAVIAVVLNVLPLLVFTRQLFIQRRRGIFQYSALIQKHHREFDQKWIYKKNQEPILGTSDPSSMIDINSSFESVMHMRIVPFDLRIMLSSLLAVILPMIILMFFEYKWYDLLKLILKLLF